MQTISDSVRAMLVAQGAQFDAGLDLLDDQNRFVRELTDDLERDGSDIEYHSAATVPRTCELTLSTELVWGRDRVRPWMTVTVGGVTSPRLYQGVFGLTTPSSQRGKAFDVSGFDLLQLLDTNCPGDTYVVDAGTSYVQAVRDVLEASDVGAPLLLDGTLQATTLDTPMVWALLPSDDQASWLRIINDLLAAINYRGLYADEAGTFRSGPYMLPAVRPVEWTFDTTDEHTDIVGPDWTEDQDRWAPYNWWRFVRTNMTTQPVLGDGIYEPAINATDPDATELGRIVRKPVQYVDAADQDSLVAQGDRTVAEDLGLAHTFEISVDPLPIGGHYDIVQLIMASDVGTTSRKCQVSSWTLPLDGSRGTWNLEVVG